MLNGKNIEITKLTVLSRQNIRNSKAKIIIVRIKYAILGISTKKLSGFGRGL